MILLLQNWLDSMGLESETATVVLGFISVLILLLIGFIAHWVAKTIVNRILRVWVERTKNQWDDLIFDTRIVPRLAHLSPVVVISLLEPILFGSVELDGLRVFIQQFLTIYVIITIILIFHAILDFGHAVFLRHPSSKNLPVKGIVQAIKLISVMVGVILVIAEVIGESPLYLFSGLGAMTAVLLLVFREAILGFVAGIQLAANNLVRPGDWIEMPKYGADGDVVDVTLTTVLVQNWDKTITSIPAYALIQDSFKNWRNMSAVGGRRIKRSLFIDTRSVQYLIPEIIEAFKGYRFLREYMEQKEAEIKAHNEMLEEGANLKVDGRVLTNIGTFRAYCVSYLRNHPSIHQDFTLLVRQRQPNEHGLPIEIYCFTNDTAWATYEGIQADIFDHLIAVLPEFGLRLFQQPSGADLESLGGRVGRSES